MKNNSAAGIFFNLHPGLPDWLHAQKNIYEIRVIN